MWFRVNLEMAERRRRRRSGQDEIEKKKKTAIENRKKPHVLQRSLTGGDGNGGERFMVCVRRGYTI
jgi:hypothetical protein